MLPPKLTRSHYEILPPKLTHDKIVLQIVLDLTMKYYHPN